MYLLDFNIFTLFMELSLVVSIVSFAIGPNTLSNAFLLFGSFFLILHIVTLSNLDNLFY